MQIKMNKKVSEILKKENAMRKIFYTFFLISLIFISVSCKSAQETTSLRVNIDRGKRTISPSASQLNIQTFVVHPIGPDGNSGTIKTVYTDSTTIEGLKLGEWTIRVEGKNNDGTVIAVGENKIMLSPVNNTVEVVLSELFGKGNLDLSFKWDSNRISDTSMTASLTPQDKNEDVIDISSYLIKDSDYTYSMFMTDLKAGSYVLTGSLYSNGEKVGGFTEAIRISNGATTKGTVSFGLDKIINSDVGFSNITSVPIECRIEGITDLIPSKTSINASVKITTGNIKESEVKAEWFLDGAKQGTGRTLSFTPEPGDHRLDVIVSTDHSGSVGSASVTFTAATLQKGLPYRMMTYKSDDKLRLGGRTFIRIVPDQDLNKINSLVVVTNDRKYLQTLIMGETSYTISQMQNLSDSNWGYTEELKDITFSGNPASGTLKATLLFDGPAISLHQFTTNGAVLSNRKIATQGALSYTSGSGDVRSLTRYGYGSVHSETNCVLCAAYNPEGHNFGYALLSTNAGDANGDWSKFVLRSVCTNSNATMQSVKYAGENLINVSDGKSVSMAVHGNGFYLLRTHIRDSGTTGIYLAGIPDVGGTISGCAVVAPEYFAILVKPTSNTSEIQIYHWNLSSSKAEKVATYSNSGARYKLLRNCPDTGFIYTIDESTKQLIVLTFSASGSYPTFTVSGSITLPDTDYDSMEISDDGSMMVLYNRTDTSRFTVLSIKAT